MTQPVGSNAQSSPLSTQAPASGQTQAPAFLQLVQAEAGKQKTASRFSMKTLPKSPGDAPSKIDLTAFQPKFAELWAKSDAPLPADDREYGGTFVTDREGNLKLVNVGKGEQGQFEPNLQVGRGETVQGVFHTHPKDSPDEPSQGFSVDDIAAMFKYKLNTIVMQSGDDQFMFLRTEATPANISPGLIGNSHGLRVVQAMDKGVDRSAAKREAAKQTAKAFGLAYYEGQNGVLTRVSP